MPNAINRSPAPYPAMTAVQEQATATPAPAAPVVSVKERAEKIAEALDQVIELNAGRVDEMAAALLMTAKSSGEPELKSLEGPDVKMAVTNFRAFVVQRAFGRRGDDPHLFAQLWLKTPAEARTAQMGATKEGLDTYTAALLKTRRAEAESEPSIVSRPAKQA